MDERVAFPGPAALGRGLVAGPGADVPDAAARWPRLRIDGAVLAAPDTAVAALDAAWRARQPTVVELAVPMGALKQPETCDLPPHDLDPGFAFPRERLHFLVWANRYDGRDPQSPPRWHHVARALRLGATTPRDPSTESDVELPDGTPAWIDGGPRTGRLLDDPGTRAARATQAARVVHVNQLWAGELRPDRWQAPGDSLAPDQMAAVGHPGGPARVLAPAGSGKTRVLTARLRHLLVDRGWAPGTVTALAYNTRAAEEMRSRTGDVPGAQVRTLHSLGFGILGQAHGQRPRLLDDRTTRDLVQELAPVRPRANDDVYAPYLEALAEVRAALRPPDLVEAQRDDVPDFARVFAAYRDRLAEMGAIDFDEQVYGAVEVLLRRPDVRQAAHRRCAHVLLDELQDLTPAQLLLVRLLAAPAYDVYGVGDDDQVIYGYAGADPRFLVDYGRFFPGAASYLLEVNYRCPPPVVEAASTLLSYNHRRVPKVIRPAPAAAGTAEGAPAGEPAAATRVLTGGEITAGAGDGDHTGDRDRAGSVSSSGSGSGSGSGPGSGSGTDPGSGLSSGSSSPGSGGAWPTGGLRVERHGDDRLGSRLVELVRELLGEGGAPESVAVLTRVNAGLLAPQVLLAEAGIPVQASVDERMLDRTGTRAALAWLRLATAVARREPLDGADLATVARRPSRGVSPGILRALGRGTWPLTRLASFAHGLDDDRLGEKLRGFHDDLAALGERAGGRATTADLLLHVRDTIGLGRALDRLDDARSAPGGGHIDDLDALVLVARAQPDPGEFEPWLRRRLRDRGPGQGHGGGPHGNGHDRGGPGGGGRVTLSTVHRVKGLEWPHVVVWDASDGVMPHRLNQSGPSLEEERRVFHVALTRARHRATVLARTGAPSPFLAELTGEAPRLPPPSPNGSRRSGGGNGNRSGGAGAGPDDRGRPGRAGARGRDRGAGGARSADGAGDELDPPGAARFDALREWRRRQATEDGVPAYVVLHDRHLKGIARVDPRTLDELAACDGIGPTKLDRYGDAVLAVLTDLADRTTSEQPPADDDGNP